MPIFFFLNINFVYYTKFFHLQNVTPDSRRNVQFVDDMELAYIMHRYREVHDLFHTVLLMPTNMLGSIYLFIINT